MGKAAGDAHVFIPDRSGWQIRRLRRHAPSGRAVRAVTGATKPHAVIRRNIFNSL